MTARKTHDADLCERIRELEERVKELEAAPHQTVIYNPPHWCFSGCPEHYPTITWGTNSTSPWPKDSTITISSGLHQQ